MKQLKNLFNLSCSVSVYVPSTKNVNEVLSESAREEYVKMVLEALSNLFGGATSYDAKGSWVSNKGLVLEDIKVCKSYCTSEQLKAGVDKVIGLCQELKSELGQEAISLEINNKLYFI